MREAYETVLRDTATQLDQRFDDDYGAIKSWNFLPPDAEPVIIDSIMTIQALTWSALNGGPASHLDHAMQHAESIIEHHLQPAETFGSDVGRYAVHVVDMAPLENGETPFISDTFFQGKEANSPWARGQSWAIEGFARLYEETQGLADPVDRDAFLTAAQDVADFFLDQTSDHAVPYWDFAVVTDPDAPDYSADELLRDTSAGSIAAAGLIRLSRVSPDPADRQRYHSAAERLLETLTDEYLNAAAGPEDASLLAEVVEHYAADLLGPRDFADYYYVLAALEFRETLHGDFNGDGIVEQGDLDLVLQNWGINTDTQGLPPEWVSDLPVEQIEQEELDKVLQNWGSASAPSVPATAVPEPVTAFALVLVHLAAMQHRDRPHPKA